MNNKLLNKLGVRLNGWSYHNIWENVRTITDLLSSRLGGASGRLVVPTCLTVYVYMLLNILLLDCQCGTVVISPFCREVTSHACEISS